VNQFDVFQTGFLYWINTTSYEVDYAKDLGTKGVYAAVFAPDYGTFVCADLSGSLFHATFAGMMLLMCCAFHYILPINGSLLSS
jgi:hypothetical protein